LLLKLTTLTTGKLAFTYPLYSALVPTTAHLGSGTFSTGYGPRWALCGMYDKCYKVIVGLSLYTTCSIVIAHLPLMSELTSKFLPSVGAPPITGLVNWLGCHNTGVARLATAFPCFGLGDICLGILYCTPALWILTNRNIR
jgi:hypothetical protein